MNSSKYRNLVIDLMSKNKHRNLIINLFIYLSFLPFTLIVFLGMILFNRFEKKVIIFFPGIIEVALLKVFKPLIKRDIFFDAFTSMYLTLVSDRDKVSKKTQYLICLGGLIELFLNYLIIKLLKQMK